MTPQTPQQARPRQRAGPFFARMKSPSPEAAAATTPQEPPGARPRWTAYPRPCPHAYAHARAGTPAAAPGTIRARTSGPVDNPYSYRIPQQTRSRSSYRSRTDPDRNRSRRNAQDRRRGKSSPARPLFCSLYPPQQGRSPGPGRRPRPAADRTAGGQDRPRQQARTAGGQDRPRQQARKRSPYAYNGNGSPRPRPPALQTESPTRTRPGP